MWLRATFALMVAVLVPAAALAQTGEIQLTIGGAYDPTGGLDPFSQADFYCKGKVADGL